TGQRGLLGTGVVVVAALVVGWSWSILHARTLTQNGEVSAPAGTPVRAIARALTSTDAPNTAYLTDAALTAWTLHLLDRQRGASGKLRVAFEPSPRAINPESLPPGGKLRYGTDTVTASSPIVPQRPGIWRVALAVG